MTKLWYIIKKKLPFAEVYTKHCGLCRSSIEILGRDGIKPNQVLIIMPDVNDFGVITSYHIGTALREDIKEAKIYDDVIKKEADK